MTSVIPPTTPGARARSSSSNSLGHPAPLCGVPTTMRFLMTPDQQKIVDFIAEKNKTKFYFKDFLDIFPEKGPREVKKILTSMVQCEVMEFWSSGSTTMYGLKGAGKQSQAEGEG